MIEGPCSDSETFGDQAVRFETGSLSDEQLDEVLHKADQELLEHITAVLSPEVLAKGLANITGEDPEARFAED